MNDDQDLTAAELEQLRAEVNALMPSHQLHLDPTWARKVLREVDRGFAFRSCGSNCCKPESAVAVPEEDVLELTDTTTTTATATTDSDEDAE